jgi:squalene-associated FAD-dependent desaturase
VDRDADELARALMRVAVIGGGWAGIAAAVRAVEAGHDATLFEMAPQLGGRARSVELDGVELDNGQHILIGAYRRTLALMHTVGVEPDAVLQRLPLDLTFADGRGLRLPPGQPVPALLRAIWRRAGWSLGDRLALLRAAAGWAVRGFRCDPAWTVARLSAHLPAALRRDLVDPLCVAALNTPADEASAAVFLRVLRDALFAGEGSSDLLLPRAPLGRLLPAPASDWLERRGARVRLRRRVQTLAARDGGWVVDDEPADAVILACTAHEAGRLTQDVAPAWSAAAGAFEHAPIVTVYLRSEGTRLPRPMTALHDGPRAPAQFVFDHGALGMTPGLFAAVVSGAGRWVEHGLDATALAVREQLAAELAVHWHTPPTVWRTVAERRATFACRPQLRRPPARIAARLWAAGDYVEGPYPSTLEGAVRAGEAAAAGAVAGR